MHALSPGVAVASKSSESSYRPYEHEASEHVTQQWAVTLPKTSSTSMFRLSGWTIFTPIEAIIGRKIPGHIQMILSFVLVTFIGITCVRKFCLGGSSTKIASEVRAARRAQNNVSYDSSDGWSGSDVSFDSRSESSNSTYETGDLSIGDLSISIDYETNQPADFH